MRSQLVLVLGAFVVGWSGSSVGVEDGGVALSSFEGASSAVVECKALGPSLCHQRALDLRAGDGGTSGDWGGRGWGLLCEGCRRGFEPSCAVLKGVPSMCHPTAIIPPSIKYPRGAREKRVAGTVSVKCTLPLDGYPRNCRIVRSVPELDQEVLRAMSSARYEPATFQGRPVQVNYVFSFKFNPSVEPSIQ